MRLGPKTLTTLADLGDPDLMEGLASFTVYGRRVPDEIHTLRGKIVFLWIGRPKAPHGP